MMHDYATNAQERQTVPIAIAVCAFAAAWLLHQVMGYYRIEVPFWVDVPSTAGFYGLGYQWFKHRLWRFAPLRWLGWTRTPLLAGRWQGFVRTSFDEHAAQHPVSIEVHQNWTELSVTLKSTHSTSHSLIGSITVEPTQVLSYEYLNEPLPGAVGTMHAHRGTARLVLSADGARLEGEYYSGRDRENQGVLILDRQ